MKSIIDYILEYKVASTRFTEDYAAIYAEEVKLKLPLLQTTLRKSLRDCNVDVSNAVLDSYDRLEEGRVIWWERQTGDPKCHVMKTSQNQNTIKALAIIYDANATSWFKKSKEFNLIGVRLTNKLELKDNLNNPVWLVLGYTNVNGAEYLKEYIEDVHRGKYKVLVIDIDNPSQEAISFIEQHSNVTMAHSPAKKYGDDENYSDFAASGITLLLGDVYMDLKRRLEGKPNPKKYSRAK